MDEMRKIGSDAQINLPSTQKLNPKLVPVSETDQRIQQAGQSILKKESSTEIDHDVEDKTVTEVLSDLTEEQIMEKLMKLREQKGAVSLQREEVSKDKEAVSKSADDLDHVINADEELTSKTIEEIEDTSTELRISLEQKSKLTNREVNLRKVEEELHAEEEELHAEAAAIKPELVAMFDEARRGNLSKIAMLSADGKIRMLATPTSTEGFDSLKKLHDQNALFHFDLEQGIMHLHEDMKDMFKPGDKINVTHIDGTEHEVELQDIKVMTAKEYDEFKSSFSTGLMQLSLNSQNVDEKQKTPEELDEARGRMAEPGGESVKKDANRAQGNNIRKQAASPENIIDPTTVAYARRIEYDKEQKKIKEDKIKAFQEKEYLKGEYKKEDNLKDYLRREYNVKVKLEMESDVNEVNTIALNRIASYENAQSASSNKASPLIFREDFKNVRKEITKMCSDVIGQINNPNIDLKTKQSIVRNYFEKIDQILATIAGVNVTVGQTSNASTQQNQ